jgi:hypothetical protein
VAGELAVLRASGHRLAAYGIAGPSMGGWTTVPAESLAPLALTTRTPGCVLRWPPGPDATLPDATLPDATLLDVTGPSVTVYGAGGEVVQLDGEATAELAERAATLLGEPGAGPVLHRALTVDSPFYEAPDRVGDVCRAVGVPLDLLVPDSTVDPARSDVVRADVGFVLLRLGAAAAAVQSPLTRQSAWIMPAGRSWCLQVWDGQPPRQPLPATAMTLSLAHRDGFALAVWWSPPSGVEGPGRAGLFLSRSGRAVAAHEWSPRFDLGIDHTASAGRALAAAFGVPERALDVTSVLRRDAADPVRALIDLLTLLRVPTAGVGSDQHELVATARATPDAVHAPRLSPLRAMVHAVRQAPATNIVDRAARERPRWYRVLNALIAAAMAFLTFVLYLNWRWDTIAGWWVVLGAATTVGYVLAARPRGRRRRGAPPP